MEPSHFVKMLRVGCTLMDDAFVRGRPLDAAGFNLPDANISTPYLWWSRPDIGFLEWIGRPVPSQREETMVNLVAYKPAQ